ncbi:jg3034 [Pararge aegeria aegeria]|uniref:Jg3034 protein n=1 Tax=Pararge aegeria aegeria TaxID=348720 RepID=A0A8S4SA48_9NEOP|nr:jg3034 [Pararge aegeria aegeria]
MGEININIEGYNVNGICVGCLNYNRKMFYNDEVKRCYKILGNIDVPDGLSIQVCWECLAHTQNVMRFRRQIIKSFGILIEYSEKLLPATSSAFDFVFLISNKSKYSVSLSLK